MTAARVAVRAGEEVIRVNWTGFSTGGDGGAVEGEETGDQEGGWCMEVAAVMVDLGANGV